MSLTVKDVLKMIEDNGIQMVDFKMVDINGQFRHVTIPAKNFNEEVMKNAKTAEMAKKFLGEPSMSVDKLESVMTDSMMTTQS